MKIERENMNVRSTLCGDCETQKVTLMDEDGRFGWHGREDRRQIE
jgi:hypothetical protein